MVFCRECGVEIINKGVKYCPECGLQLKEPNTSSPKNKNPSSKTKFIDPALKDRDDVNESFVQGRPLFDAMKPGIQGHKNNLAKLEENLNKAADKFVLIRRGLKVLIEQNNILIKQNELIYLQNNDIINALERLNKK